MLSSSKKKGTIAILLYFAVYTVVTVQHYQFWGDFLSALGGSVATLILIHTWKTEIKKEMLNLWALLIFAIGCHVVGDLIWFISRWALHMDPFA